MCGVYDKTELYCDRCKKRTPHETGWEDEEPDCLEEKCLTCGKHELINTATGSRTNIRVVQVSP